MDFELMNRMGKWGMPVAGAVDVGGAPLLVCGHKDNWKPALERMAKQFDAPKKKRPGVRAGRIPQEVVLLGGLDFLTRGARGLYFALCCYAGRDWCCTASIDKLCRTAHLTRKTLRRLLRVLEDRGLIEVGYKVYGEHVFTAYRIVATLHEVNAKARIPKLWKPKAARPNAN